MTSGEFQVGGGRARYVLIICSLLYMVNYMDRQVLSIVLEPMKIDLGLTDAQAGWIQTVFLLSIGLFAMPVSYLIDRWSRSKMIGLMAIAWSAATFVTGLGWSFVAVLIPRFLTGVGEAGFSAGGTALITASYPEKDRSKKLGVFNLFIILDMAMLCMYVGGGAWSPALTGWLSDMFGGGARGLTFALMITGSFGVVAFACWWRSAGYYPADAEKASEIV